ncbi:MAG: HlyD family efflux transporter periplasmic adaptor subunit [Gemmatimonadaceae bacterium]
MMRFLRTRWFALSLVVVALLAGTSTYLRARDTGTPEAATSIAKVKRGEFKVFVTTAGELRARKFVQITVPTNAQQAEVYNMKIQSLVPEGTVVKAGDIVAELDRSTLAPKLQEVTLALQKAQLQLEQAQLDSTLALSQAREDMRTMELALEEKRIAQEQASFEAPSVKRQAAIDMEKATRALAKAKVDYKTKTDQAISKQREIGTDLAKQQNRVNSVQGVMGEFSIKAPSPGMVIYVKEWNGRKKTAGSQVTPWEPAVATLPDLSQMESVTYVNEIDVRKVSVNQKVKLALDADPSKALSGTVVEVANVGEQRPNADAKVFEVKVAVDQSDTTLRPGMTTSNAVETYSIPNALFIPIEAVHSDSSIAYVFKKSGNTVTKQQIETGAMNDNEVVVLQGLTDEDRVLLTPPANHDKLTLSKIANFTPMAPPNGDKGVETKVKIKADSAAKSPNGSAVKTPVTTPTPAPVNTAVPVKKS